MAEVPFSFWQGFPAIPPLARGPLGAEAQAFVGAISSLALLLPSSLQIKRSFVLFCALQDGADPSVRARSGQIVR